MVGVDAAAVFLGGPAADVHLVAGPAALAGVVAEVDAAVVLAVLVDHELQFQLEVLELVLRREQAGPLGVAVLAADDGAVLDPPLGRAEGRPSVEVPAVEQRPPARRGGGGPGGG